MQTVQIKTWGNSKGVRIPKNILTELELEDGAELEISVDKTNRSITLQVADDGLTPYLRILFENAKTEEQRQMILDRLKD